MNAIKKHFPGPAARMILRIDLPILLLASVVLLISYLQAREIDPAYANVYYGQGVEYILASFVLAVGSFCLIDTVERNQKSEQK